MSEESYEEFVARWKGRAVTVITDVRSIPCSRYHPQYYRETLQSSLKEQGIEVCLPGGRFGCQHQ